VNKNVVITGILFKAKSGNLNDVIYTGTMPTLSSSINGSTWTLTHEKMPTLIDAPMVKSEVGLILTMLSLIVILELVTSNSSTCVPFFL
jgi:hypothetical protein